MYQHPCPRPRSRARRHTRRLESAWKLGVVLLTFGCLPISGLAHELSVEECVEGSDFISNAARARDSGVNKSTFLDQVQQDIVTIQAFPPPLRWFVQDEDDAEFLISGASGVFDQPQDPDAHRNQFLVACLDRGASQRQPQRPNELPWIPGKLPPRQT